MTILDATSPIAGAQDPRDATQHKAATVADATQQFESILLKQMLQALERTTKVSPEGAGAGQSLYGSIIVDVVADSIANSGGLGLGQMMERAIDLDSKPQPRPGPWAKPKAVP